LILWSDPTIVQTERGEFYIRKWTVPSELEEGFSSFWNKNLHLRDRGFSYIKEPVGWVLQEKRRLISDFSDMGKYASSEKYNIPEFVEEDIPDIKDTSGLMEWQPKVVSKLCSAIKKHRVAIDGSDMGTGKSYCAIAVARELGMSVGVVCPKAVVTAWERIISNHFGMDREFVINYEGLRTGKYKDIGEWVRPNKNSTIKNFTWNIKNPKNTLLIFDESHKIKNWNSQLAEIALAAYKSRFNILCLSATSAVSPVEMRVIGKLLQLHEGKLKSFEEFLKFYGCEQGRYGWKFESNGPALKRLNYEIFKLRGARIKKESIPSFPDCLLSAEAYTLDAESTKKFNSLYSKLQSELKRINDIQEWDKKKGNSTFVNDLRVRQKLELLKIPILVELTENAIEAGMSVAIFANFTETINTLSEILNVKCIVSGDHVKERQNNIDRFQSDEERVILVNVRAGGAGLGLHDINGKYSRLALISPPLSSTDLKQVTGRVWRSGSKSKAIQKIIFVANSPEENVCKTLKSKLYNMDMINDGDLISKQIF
jgi:superfamily II DNA or RNA helicase